MPLPTSINDLSQTAGSNSPAGSESPSLIDDYLRTYASYIALLRDQSAYAPQTIASAATTDIGAAVSNVIYISGTTTITALGTAAAGVIRTVKFLGALVVTHNATSLILPGTTNITTAANDTAEFMSLGSGNWQCTRFSPASGNYIKANIVGTVSQGGGLPTGAIIEEGSNGNGQFTKFADGTMICRLQYSIVINVNVAFGSLFYAAIPSLAFPQAFIAIPSLSLQVAITGGGGWVGRDLSSRTTTATGNSIVFSAISRSSESVTMDYIAVGRWRV